MKVIKTIKTSKWRDDSDNPYLKRNPYKGQGFHLLNPGENIGYGVDESSSNHPPAGYSASEERIRVNDLPQATDGGYAADGSRPPPMQGNAFQRSPDDPNSLESFVNRANNSDISRDRKPGIHNMNANIYDRIYRNLKSFY